MIGRLASPAQRRELRPYVRYLLARGSAGAWMRPLTAARAVQRERRRVPDGLSLPASDRKLRCDQFVARVPLSIPSGSKGDLEAIRLATRSWHLADGAPWTGSFEDSEDRLAAHRFGWVLTALAEHGADALGPLLRLVVAWVRAHPTEPAGPGWDSYSVAERLCHFAWLASALVLTGRAGHADGLCAPIAAHARFLRAHLELRGASTNNHLINNGRALYVAGALIGDERLRAEAQEIIRFGVARMFVGGFLREGSSHYHVLLCRTFLELLLVARATGDTSFVEELVDQVRPMVRAARFFEGATEIPLTGDLSPDFTPAFLRSVAAFGESLLAGGDCPGMSGWAGFFSAAAPMGSEVALEGASDTRCHAKAGYYHLARSAWRVWAWVNPDGYVPAWSHAHADIGSFVAAWRGTPLLVDSGRTTYRNSALGEYGRSVRSHNTVSIDGHEPCVVHGMNGFPELMAEDYFLRPPRAWCDVVDTPTLHIEIPGFARLGDSLLVHRTISIHGNALTVDDAVTGAGNHRVETFFHLHPDVTVKSTGASTVECATRHGHRLAFHAPDGTRTEVKRGVPGHAPVGWYARAYGALEPCATIICTASGPARARRRYLFEPA